ncbi:rod shape-determining protein MreC [Frankia sp. AiPs1]|uniref:rod shape-determining protein MreC n=1 Tax=Frankia sp. AiPa1 TaxID=573492 RepID=UPI00202AD47C|nr:rod shape-determining protein MreC [Frankia sp. AiPa1]MCL9761804.1 rod shape-determining protein MreC [Frankia sp. AiPa1]
MGRGTGRSRLVIVALLILAFTLITLDYRTGRSATGARGVVHSALGGVEDGLTAVVRPVGRALSSLAHPNRYHDRADRLAEENAKLRRQLADDGEITRTGKELADLRLLADKGQYSLVPAKVIAIGDVSGTDWTVTINAGKADGVAADKTVVNSDGLVGTVATVTAHTAVVRLACDPNSRIGARLERTQLLGAVAGGQGPSSLVFTLYDASYRVQKGDRLTTFGSLDYVAGVPIGEVTKVTDVGGLSRTAEVKPYVSVGSLDLVGVVVARPSTDPGDRLLPPRPAPAASAAPTTPPPTTPPSSAPSPAVSAGGTASPGGTVSPGGAALPGGGASTGAIGSPRAAVSPNAPVAAGAVGAG